MTPLRPPHAHPRRDPQGRAVLIESPSIPSPLEQWRDATAIAVAVPDGSLVETLNGVAFARWVGPAAWAEHASISGAGAGGSSFDDHPFDEPPFEPPSSLAPAAGVVTLEPDGRAWLVAPTNGYGGYKLTFPKGKLDGLDRRVSACKEAWEESGLQVELTRFLADVPRSTSYTRYYLARRIGGTPADMGWESQAVWLVPGTQLASVASHPNDRPLLAALAALGV
ncbi:MAG: NUDIX hydrolase [Gammaproteobacteria bacterium]